MDKMHRMRQTTPRKNRDNTMPKLQQNTRNMGKRQSTNLQRTTLQMRKHRMPISRNDTNRRIRQRTHRRDTKMTTEDALWAIAYELYLLNYTLNPTLTAGS